MRAWWTFYWNRCKLQKVCTRLAATSDKVYQLLAHGRWFSPGTPASSITKTGRHDIAEILLKVALNTINQIKSCGHCIACPLMYVLGIFILFLLLLICVFCFGWLYNNEKLLGSNFIITRTCLDMSRAHLEYLSQ